MWRPQYTVCVVVITGGQSSNKVEPSSVIVMLLSVYTHLTIPPGQWIRSGYLVVNLELLPSNVAVESNYWDVWTQDSKRPPFWICLGSVRCIIIPIDGDCALGFRCIEFTSSVQQSRRTICEFNLFAIEDWVSA